MATVARRKWGNVVTASMRLPDMWGVEAATELPSASDVVSSAVENASPSLPNAMGDGGNSNLRKRSDSIHAMADMWGVEAATVQPPSASPALPNGIGDDGNNPKNLRKHSDSVHAMADMWGVAASDYTSPIEAAAGGDASDIARRSPKAGKVSRIVPAPDVPDDGDTGSKSLPRRNSGDASTSSTAVKAEGGEGGSTHITPSTSTPSGIAFNASVMPDMNLQENQQERRRSGRKESCALS